VRIEELAAVHAPHALALAGGYQARAAAGPPVEVGEAEVSARVAVTWALLDAPQLVTRPVEAYHYGNQME
jgi:uncharacterized protein YggE